MILKVQLSYDKTQEAAMQGAHEQWKTNIFGSDMLAELRTPKQFDQAGQFVKPEEVQGFVNISHEPEQHIEWLEKYVEMGFHELDLHNVNTNQEQFIEVFGEKVIPAMMVS
jgi:coenzyme F420-dependent glucose-6-phosphate dehydrogenase